MPNIITLPCAQHDWSCSVLIAVTSLFQKRELLLQTLHFTALLIEHSFSRHLYNSVEHLIQLLEASDMQVKQQLMMVCVSWNQDASTDH